MALRGNRITAVGPASDAPEVVDANQVDAAGRWILPGLINGHQHAAMALFRGVADDLALMDWLENYIFPAEAENVTPEFVYWGTKLSLAEMLLNGTTTYSDMYYFEGKVAEATAEAGMRGVLGQTIIGFKAPDYATPEEALEGTADFVKQWKDHPLVTPAVAPHAPYTCSPEVLKAARELSDRLEVPLLIHLAETESEVEQIRKQHGTTPVRFLQEIGFLSPRMTGFHVVWIDDEEMREMARVGAGAIHNPDSNMKLASGVAPVTAWIKAGMDAGIGTDGPASNNNLDLFEEMRSAALLQKLTRKDPRALDARTVLEMATRRGAAALHMEDQIGSLEAGKKADLILVDPSRPAGVPAYHPYSALVYSLRGNSVHSVMIDGRWVVRNRTLLTLDWEKIQEKAAHYRRQVSASVKKD